MPLHSNGSRSILLLYKCSSMSDDHSPRRANSHAVALPIPLLAPVTTTVLPSSLTFHQSSSFILSNCCSASVGRQCCSDLLSHRSIYYSSASRTASKSNDARCRLSKHHYTASPSAAIRQSVSNKIWYRRHVRTFRERRVR